MWLNLEGLLPPYVSTQESQSKKIMNLLRSQATDIDRYQQLAILQSRNQKLFYYVLQHNVEELLPIVYTPTVGLACQLFGNLYQQSRGLYVSIEHRGRVADILRHWTEPDVRAIVFTDGERILGLGDLGASGMGISIGKIALYTALGGCNPRQCLPVTLDVGTDNDKLRHDVNYTGLRIKRVRGKLYDNLVDEFIQAARSVFGENVLLQFEDFGNANAFRLLRKYESQCCTFNDDIQGTASVITAGVLAGVPLTGVPLENHKFLFYGAGSAGLGIAQLIAAAVAKKTGCTLDQARANIWCVDSRGLVFKGRKTGGLNQDKLHFAHPWGQADTLGLQPQALEVYIQALGITGIFGVSAQPGVFTEKAVKACCENIEKPLIFALSNPTSKAECTAEQAYSWSEGKCLFASGSPFKPVTLANGEIRVPGQGNNSYIFPGVALATICTGSRRVLDSMFLTAAETLAAQVTNEQLASGCLYPPLSLIREVTAVIAAAVAADVYDNNLQAVHPRPEDLLQFVKDSMWSCEYSNFCPPGFVDAYAATRVAKL